MQFPVTIVFNSLGWGVTIAVEDGTGARIGFAPYRIGRDGKLWVYRDEGMAEAIYVVEIQTRPFGTYVLRNASGTTLGSLALAEGGSGYVVSVGDEPHFEVRALSPGLHFVDWLFDTIPVVNVVTGLLMRPCHVFKRRGGEVDVATMIKQRTMFDANYRLEPHSDFDGPEGECMVLASIVIAMHARRFLSLW